MSSLVSLILRSFFFYRRSHVAVGIGAALTALVLTGALMIGDSLRYSLFSLAAHRLGKTHLLIISQQGDFRQSLADSMTSRLGTPVAPIFLRSALVTANMGQLQANRVALLGVDHRFWSLGPLSSSNVTLADGEVAISSSLARKLALKKGDEIVIRFDKGGPLPLEAPFSELESAQQMLRAPIKAIIARDRFGEVNLNAGHGDVYNIFLPLDRLSALCGRPDRATVLLVGKSDEVPVRTALNQSWSLSDGGLRLESISYNSEIEISSDRIFLPDSLVSTIRTLNPNAGPIFTYFVNSLQSSRGMTPYSFVSTPIDGRPLGAQEVLLGEWIAEDLDCTVGDSVLMRYFVPQPTSGLREDSSWFIVAGVVPSKEPWADSTLMPPFPGLMNAATCNDWNPGIPVNLDRIRPKDEAYWERWRGTPKAFISLPTAQKLWGNRFGVCTAIRVPSASGQSTATLEKDLRSILSPGKMGLHVVDIRNEVMRSIEEGTSFAPLFGGMSFFVLIAALSLTGLLFGCALQSRHEHLRSLRAMGFGPRNIRVLFLGEGMIAAAVGALAGTIAAPLYTAIILVGIHSLWRAAAPVAAIGMHIRISTCLIGFCISTVAAALSILFAVNSFLRRSSVKRRIIPSSTTKSRELSLPFSLLCAGGAAILLVTASGKSDQIVPAFFFGAGSLLLISLLLMFNHVLIRVAGRSSRMGTVALLAVTAASRNRSRSTMMASTFAAALFVLGTVGVFRQGDSLNPRERNSGTGGFWWYGEFANPIIGTHVSESYLKERGMADSNALLLPLRLRAGDDASCLSLNRTRHPALIGVDYQLMDSIGAFSFVRGMDQTAKNRPWTALGKRYDPFTIPGYVDQSVLEWGLGAQLGDTLRYTDEHGSPVNVVLSGTLQNSIFQGRVLIAEKHFVHHFPSLSGYRIILAQTSPGKEKMIGDVVRTTFSDKGLDLETTAERLASFNQVQNTYLSIFAFLGLLGVLIAGAGMGVVVMHTVRERQDEFSLLLLLGFRLSTVRLVIFIEHAAVFLAGAVMGVLASLCAAAPLAYRNEANYFGTLLPFVLVLCLGLGSAWVGVASIPKDLFSSRHNE